MSAGATPVASPPVCVLDCADEPSSPVCASNGVTYSSACLFQFDKCSTKSTALFIVARGACVRSNSSSNGSDSTTATPSPCAMIWTPVPLAAPSPTPLPTSVTPRPSATRANTDCEHVRKCADAAAAPVCASDGRTYTTACELARAMCVAPSLTVVRAGPCGANSDRSDRSGKLEATVLDPVRTLSPSSTATATPASKHERALANSTASDGTQPRSMDSTATLVDVLKYTGVSLGVAVLSLVLVARARRYVRSRSPVLLENDDVDDLCAFRICVLEDGAAFEPSPSPQTNDSRHTRSNKHWEDDAIVAARIPREKVAIDELLATGGSCEVYCGTYNNQRVAVKMLRRGARGSLDQINAFLEEIQLTAALQHERIVQFIGVAWDSLNDLCVVSEYMDGGDLRGLLTRFDTVERRRCGFDPLKVEIALRVAHALTYLHSLDPAVVHRDLKSKNILLSASMEAKLSDFGTSREREDCTMTGGVGTSLWMAPEVVMGERYDAKADIFSFGVVLSELDSHLLPYAHASSRGLPAPAVVQLVVAGELSVQFSPSTPRAIAALGRACVQVDPAKRPSAADVLYALHLELCELRRSVCVAESSVRVA